MTYSLNGLMVFFLIAFTPLAHAETKVYFSPNGGCQQAVITEINAAHSSIDIAMFDFTSREIALALVEAKERKVNVRIVLDKAQLKDHYSKSRYLNKKGFNIKYHMGQGIMHNKFAVIDDKSVLTGSYNWTVSADKRNAENLLVIRDPELARKYDKQFKQLWGQGGEGQPKEEQQD